MTTSDLIIVLLWLLVTGTGIVLTAIMMVLTKSDGEFLKDKNIDGAAQALAKLSFWQEFRRFFVKLFLFTVGLSAFFQPPVPDVCKVHSAYSWIFIAALFGVALLLNYSTIAAMRYRKHFITGDYDGKPTDV